MWVIVLTSREEENDWYAMCPSWWQVHFKIQVFIPIVNPKAHRSWSQEQYRGQRCDYCFCKGTVGARVFLPKKCGECDHLGNYFTCHLTYYRIDVLRWSIKISNATEWGIIQWSLKWESNNTILWQFWGISLITTHCLAIVWVGNIMTPVILSCRIDLYEYYSVDDGCVQMAVDSMFHFKWWILGGSSR